MSYVAVCINKELKLVSTKVAKFRDETGLDLSFQSEARWDAKQKTRYATSLVKGMAPSKIIVANIKGCLELCSDETYDYDYFQSWADKGMEYISIDGNNRTITIYEYLNNKVTIAHGEYYLPSGDTVRIDSKNDTFKTHPKALKEHIQNNINLTICEYVVSDRKTLSDLFININDGSNLNPQELRNAIIVPFAQSIRDLVKENMDAFKFIFKDNNRRAVDEQLVNLSVYFTYGAEHGITKSDKDRAYEDDSTVWKNFKSAKKAIETTLNMIEKYADAGFKDVSTLLNFFIVVTEIQKRKQKILNEEQFFKWFMRTENRRVADQTILLKKKKGEHRNYSSCNDTTSGPELLERYNYIMKDLKNIGDNIITEIDSERLFTDFQRYEMWKRQDGICPLTGELIPEEEINNHDLWAADHIVPFSKGGKTVIDNGQLINKKSNLKKGNKMPELVAA